MGNDIVTKTPAGDPYDLSRRELPKADGLLIMAAHISRHGTLTEWIDASIQDETAPFQRVTPA